MSIPLSQLYHFIYDMACQIHGRWVILYRFFPDGSKDIKDLSSLHNDPKELYYTWLNLGAEIFCNDQEPLDYDLYENSPPLSAGDTWTKLINQKNLTFPKFNLRGSIRNIWDKAILLHSEQRSAQIDRYRAGQFIPVYYWSHALIAQDWFRYAQHVRSRKRVKKTFLVYNRAWAGTREYRLKFVELIIDRGLANHCQTYFNSVDPQLGTHYGEHAFTNPIWKPVKDLENIFPTATAHSGYSANFAVEDYNQTHIEVVLETLFDDSRLHLTEKILRPLACGQPFILVATHGSLQYLKRYGFQTFSDLWDESYDQIEDPSLRLNAMIDLMVTISQWPADVLQHKMSQAQAICEHNRQHFFSATFRDMVIAELDNNLREAFEELESTNTATLWIEKRKLNYSDPELRQVLISSRDQKEADHVLEQALRYYKRTGNKFEDF